MLGPARGDRGRGRFCTSRRCCVVSHTVQSITARATERAQARSMKSLLSILGVLLLAAPALADVVPIEEEACVGRAVGAACTAGPTSGTCQLGTCTRLSYGDGSMPTPMEYECTRCSAGSTPPPSGGCSVTLGGSGAAAAALVLALAALARRRA